MAEKRQVKDAKYAMSHNLGLGSAVVVTILKKYNDNFDLKEYQSSDPVKLEEFEKKRNLNGNRLRAKF